MRIMSGRRKKTELEWMGRNGVTVGVMNYLLQDLNRPTKKFVKTRRATWLTFKSANSHVRRTRAKFWATTVWGSMFMLLNSTIFSSGFPVSLAECYIKNSRYKLNYVNTFSEYNKPTRCNSGSIVFINNYRYAVHVSDAFASIIRSTINCNSSHWCLS